MPARDQAAEEGRIPFALRIGVIGHRQIGEHPGLTAAAREALARLVAIAPVSTATPLVPVVVSALAEGADRLVVREVLAAEGSRLEAALPLPPEEYLMDFESEASRQEFLELLDRSSETLQAPPSPSREEAYERAGRYVVDRCDAVIALWDGEHSQGRGGTAEIVEYAREREVPLVWVRTKDEPVVIDELETPRAGVIAEAAEELDLYNRSRIPAKRFGPHVEKERKGLQWRGGPSDRGGPGRLSVEEVARWFVPYFVRADLLALRFERRFNLMSVAVFLLAPIAVAILETQTAFFPDKPWIVAFQVAALLGVLAILVLSRRSRMHERWISYRFVAERLRSLYFLTLAGAAGRHESSARLAYFTDPSELWIERALSELTARHPTVPRDLPVDELREYLAAHWITGQARYHEASAGQHRRRDSRLVRLTAVLFAVTLVISILHMTGIGGADGRESRFGALLVVLAIVVPVIGASAHGIGSQLEFRRHSERYRRMVELLQRLRADLLEARTLEDVRTAAMETERVMREENSDWFGVMRFHDMELIT
jgi:hypothetical protein